MKKIVLLFGVCSILWHIQFNVYGEDSTVQKLQELEKAGIERVLVEAYASSPWEMVQSIPLRDIDVMTWKDDGYIVSLKTPYKGKKKWVYKEPDYIRSASGKLNEGPVEEVYNPFEQIGIDVLMKEVENIDGTVTVAIIDSGIDRSLEIFNNRLVDGYDYVNDDDEPEDAHGHGTSVAGIIARGTPEQVKLMPIRVLGKDGKGSDYAIAKAIYYAINNDAKVINLSLAGIGRSDHLNRAMNKALEKGIIIVAGAGNDCIDTKHVYPAGKKEIIVVSAVDTQGEISLFSNYGDSIDIAAPGEEIDALADGYKEKGTSLAAPFITAIGAMLAIVDDRLDTKRLEGYLQIYSDDMGLAMKDKAYGYGKVNFRNYFLDSTLQIIAYNEYLEPYGSSYIKLYSDTGNRTLYIHIDGREAYTYTIQEKGYYTVTYDVTLAKGEHLVEIYLDENQVSKPVANYTLDVRDYNLVFEVYNQRGELSTDYTLRLSGGLDNEELVYLGDENMDGYFRNGRYYMTLDIEALFEEYDYILALCEPVDINNDGHKVPIYCKKILTTGRKAFRPDFVQTVYYDAANYANIYMQVNDGLTNQYQWVGLSMSKGQQQILLDQGEHRVFIAADQGNYLYTLQNDYYLILNNEDLREVIVDTSNLRERSMELLTNVAYMDTKPIPFDSYDSFQHLDKVGPVRYNPNRYRFYASVSQGEEGLELYRDIDLIENDRVKITFGEYLTNEYVVHYNEPKKQVMVRIHDDLKNRYILFTDRLKLMLRNEKTGKAYEGRLSYEDRYQGVELYEIYDFKYEEIPDGSYVLETVLEGDYIMPVIFNNQSVKVRDGMFYETQFNKPPKVNKVPHMFSIEPYHTFELNLKEVFSSDEPLFYTVDQGYIIEDTLYFEGNAKGLFTFNIGAYDFKHSVVKYTCQVLVKDDIIFKKLLEEEMKDHTDSSLQELLFRTYKVPNEDDESLEDDGGLTVDQEEQPVMNNAGDGIEAVEGLQTDYRKQPNRYVIITGVCLTGVLIIFGVYRIRKRR